MSDYVPDIPYAPGTPEYAQYLRTQALLPSAMGAGALTQLLPAQRDDQGNVSPAIPGIATGAYGVLGAVAPDLINLGSRALGYDLNIPHAPGADAAEQMYQRTKAEAQDIIPPQGVNEVHGGQALYDVGSAVGGASVPIPGGLVSSLPRAARAVTSLIAPTADQLKVAVPAAALISGGAEALAGQSDENPNDPVKAYQSMTAQPSQGGTTTLPFDTTSPTSQAPTAPTFSQEGDTGTPYWMRALEVAGGLAGAWVGVKYGGKLLNPVIDTLQGVDRSAAATAQVNAAITARDAGTALPRTSLAPGPDINVPLPGGADAPTTRAANYLYDKNRIVNAFTDEIAPTQSTAQALQNSVGTTESQASFAHQIGAQMRTGVNMFTGTPGIKMYDVIQGIDALNPGQRQVLNYGMWAADELNNRLLSGGGPVNFVKTDNSTLAAAVRLMMSDPEVAAVKNQFQMLNSETLSIRENMGMISPREANAFRIQRPDWMPSVDIDGNVQTGINPRDVGRSGWEHPPTTAWDAQMQGMFDAYRDMQRNSTSRSIINNAINWQNADPARPLVFTEKLDTSVSPPGRGEGGTGRLISVMDGGVKRTYNVNNDTLYSAMTRSAPQMGTVIDTANKMRTFLQANITGPMAALTQQRLFAPIQFARGVLQVPVERSAGTYGGPFDRFLQQHGLPGYRGLDPTFVAGAADTAMRNAASSVAKNFGDMLAAKSNPVSQAFRSLKGDTWTNAMAQRMQQLYGNSKLAENVAAGVSNIGGSAITEPPTFLTRGGTHGYMNPLADVFPDVFGPENVRLPGMKGTTATYINLRSLMRDIHTQISEAPNAYYYQLNKSNTNFSSQTMARLARGVIGDPTMTGAGKIPQAIGKVVPYFNPTVQDLVRMVRNFRDAPIASMTGEMSTQVMVAAASVLTAMLGGQSHVNHLENQMTTQQRAADVTFYHDPTNPLNNTQISLPQRWRPMYPYILEAVATGVGAFQAHQGEPAYDRVVHTLADLFNHHVQTSTDTSARHGLANMLDLTPPLGIGGMASSPVSALMENATYGRPLETNIFKSVDDPSRVPGQMGGSTYISNNDGNSIQTFLSALGGGLGTAYHTFLQTPYTRLKEGSGFWGALSGMGSDVLQNFRDNNPSGNIVWGNTAKLTKFDPLAESVSNSLDAIKRVGSSTDMSSLGLAGAGPSMPVIVNDSNKVPTDPDMQKMWLQVANFKPTLAPLMKDRNAISTQMQEVTSSGYGAQDKRQLLNDLTGQYADKTAQIDARIRWLNAKLSDMAGGRAVHVASINWDRGLDQFH